MFHCTNFESSDLTDVTAKHCYFVKANFKCANLSGLNIGIFPDLKGHQNQISSIYFSPDGTMIVTGSNDKSIMIWDAETGT